MTLFVQMYDLLLDQDGQDFAEYALLLGAIGAVAAVVIARFKNELIRSFNYAIRQLSAARN